MSGIIRNVGLTVFDVIGMFSNLILAIFRNVIPLFILFVFVYYILIKLFDIRGEEQ